MSALFGTILAVTAGIIALRATRPINLYNKSITWPKVHATILSATLREDTDSEGTAYRPEFIFRYSIGGCEYTSNRHTEGMPFEHTKVAVSKLVAKFPVSTTVMVAVKPNEPTLAVLDTGAPRQWIVIRRVSLGLIIIGLAFILREVF